MPNGLEIAKAAIEDFKKIQEYMMNYILILQKKCGMNNMKANEAKRKMQLRHMQN